MNTIKLLNGDFIFEAVKLEDCLNMNKFYYADNKIILTDQHNNELNSIDIRHIMFNLQPKCL